MGCWPWPPAPGHISSWSITIFPVLLDFRVQSKSLMNRQNKSGLSGQPCRTPLAHLNSLDVYLSYLTTDVALLYMCFSIDGNLY